MNNNSATPDKTFRTPWIVRAYATLPGNPFWIGSVSAYAHALMTAQKTTHALMPVASHSPAWSAVASRAGKHRRVVLLIIGLVSVMSLLGIEARYGSVLMSFWVSFIVLAWIGMLLPLRGIRKKIKAAKLRELDWCRQAQKNARNNLKSDASGQQSMAAVMAYKTLLVNIRNWPFDNPTLVRFTLYLMIPLGSWLGGALVERGLDVFLS